MTTVTGSDGLTYTLDSGTLTISGNGTISAILQGVVDSTLDCTGATRLVIEPGITSIGNNGSFQYCHFTYAELPEGLTTIGRNAFPGNSLVEIRIPSTVTYIGWYAFSGNTTLTSIIFAGDEPTTMEGNCFSTGSTNLTIYSNGWADGTTITSAELGSTTATFVTGVPTPYYGLKIGGNKVQVDSAVRDGQGNKIDVTYQQKLVSGTNIKTVDGVSLLGSGNVSAGWVYADYQIVVGSCDPGNYLTKSFTSLDTSCDYLIMALCNPGVSTEKLADTHSGSCSVKVYNIRGTTQSDMLCGFLMLKRPKHTTSPYVYIVPNTSLDTSSLWASKLYQGSTPKEVAVNDMSNVNVGSANSGKVLGVDSDGTITYVTAGAGSVTDVQVNGTSVMDGTVAKVVALQNRATGTDALAVGPTSSTATAYGHAVAVGDSCEVNSDYSLALGSHAYVSQYSQGAIAIGLYAQISSPSRGYAIQLGRGSNAEANTFYVGLGQSANYKLLGSDGVIPTDRLPFSIGATDVIITEVN